jgi:hypothetical protein
MLAHAIIHWVYGGDNSNSTLLFIIIVTIWAVWSTYEGGSPDDDGDYHDFDAY